MEFFKKAKHFLQPADIGDYLKFSACTAVILQTVLQFACHTQPTVAEQRGIAIVYNLTKFTAPAFIFGILYTTTRTTLDTAGPPNWQQYFRTAWQNLGRPTCIWTLIYLLFFPNLQQKRPYHNSVTFLEQFLNGNAAPHLWYNTMMLQFIILMPLFSLLVHWCNRQPGRGWLLAGSAVVVAGGWLFFYDAQILHGAHASDWYWCDRLGLSFGLYGIGGMLAGIFPEWWERQLQRVGNYFFILFVGTLIWINWEFFQLGLPIVLARATYYKWSTTIYDLTVISFISYYASKHIQNHPQATKKVHWGAQLAYRAYLAHVFWLQLLWNLGGQLLVTRQLLGGVVLLYGLTWLLAFSSAQVTLTLSQKLQARAIK